MIVDENGMCTLSEEDCSYHSHTAKRTNADRIRSLSDEELAERFAILTDCMNCPCRDPYDKCNTVDGSCKKQWLKWLKEEAKGGGI